MPYYSESFGSSKLIRNLIIINVVVYILQLIPSISSAIIALFSLEPTSVLHLEVWRLLTYGFLHDPSSIFHIIFNMFGLWMFGTSVESRIGSKSFLIFYIFSILFAGLFSLLYPIFGYYVNVIGASGGVLAVMTLYAIFYPNRELLIWGIIPIKAWVATLLFALVSIFGTIGGGGTTAHLTHLGGIAAAFVYIWLEPKISRAIISRIEKKRRVSKPTKIHYFEPRKSRLEILEENATIDDVLKRVSEVGMESLSDDEIRVLEKASGKPIRRDPK